MDGVFIGLEILAAWNYEDLLFRLLLYLVWPAVLSNNRDVSCSYSRKVYSCGLSKFPDHTLSATTFTSSPWQPVLPLPLFAGSFLQQNERGAFQRLSTVVKPQEGSARG